MPCVGVSSPASRPSSVVLPLPDGPTIATKAPCGIENETSRSTASVLSPLRYSLVRSRATSMRLRNRVRVGGGVRIGGDAVLAAVSCVRAPRVQSDATGGGDRRDPTATPSTRTAQFRRRRVTAGVASTRDASTILFVGTSLTAGLGLEPDSAYPMLIQRKIDSAGLAVRGRERGRERRDVGRAARPARLAAARRRSTCSCSRPGRTTGCAGFRRRRCERTSRRRSIASKRSGPTRGSCSSRWRRCRTSAPKYAAAFHAVYPAVAQGEGRDAAAVSARRRGRATAS